LKLFLYIVLTLTACFFLYAEGDTVYFYLSEDSRSEEIIDYVDANNIIKEYLCLNQKTVSDEKDEEYIYDLKTLRTDTNISSSSIYIYKNGIVLGEKYVFIKEDTDKYKT
jgi:outer membrane lipopolysaccharide assembly protein LptE/RlpB